MAAKLKEVMQSASDLVEGVSGNQLYLYDQASRVMSRGLLDNPWASVIYPLLDLSSDGNVIVFQDTI